MAIVQDRTTGNYRAVVMIAATGFAEPKMNVTSPGAAPTAELPLFSLTDQTGTALGTVGNPLFVSGGGGGGAGAPKGYQQIIGMVAATTLTVPATATYAIISAEGQDVRWRDDGGTPTASAGMPLYAGQAPVSFVGDLAALQFIQTAPSSTLNISYYG